MPFAIRLLPFAALLALGACRHAAAPGGPDGVTPADVPSTDGATVADVASTHPACAALDACACLARSDCRTVTEACWCPFPACGRGGACICGGGRYWGCAAATCPPTGNCRDGGVGGPDDAGCFSCAR